MKINKISTGFVIQVFDTEKQKFIKQEFISSDEVQYENENGNVIKFEEMEKFNFGPYAKEEPYLPFDMVQPKD
jgi:hypothetical protein